MTLTTAQLIRVGQAVQACYDDSFIQTPGLVKVPASTVTIIYGTDADGVVRPYGAVYFDTELQAWCIVLRGTIGWAEWLKDAEAPLVDCPFLAGARTHLGFTTLYQTLTAGGEPLRVFLSTLPGMVAAPLIFVGHSLGSALATCAAADWGQLAILVTFASPRVGDDHFCSVAMSRLGGNYRLVNAPDIVPRLPIRLEPLFPYNHLGVAMEMNSGAATKSDVHAWHSVITYLHCLDPGIPIEPEYAA